MHDRADDVIERWSREQVELKRQLITHDDVAWGLPWAATEHADCEALRLVGGVDISFYPDEAEPVPPEAGPQPPSAAAGLMPSPPPPPPPQQQQQRGVAALVVLSYPDMAMVYADFEPLSLEVPYISGFLAFREVPAFERLLARAASRDAAPQVVLVDGCGVLHPRGFGAACHLGVASGVPTIGVAKKLLFVEGLDKAAVRAALGTVGGGVARCEADACERELADTSRAVEQPQGGSGSVPQPRSPSLTDTPEELATGNDNGLDGAAAQPETALMTLGPEERADGSGSDSAECSGTWACPRDEHGRPMFQGSCMPLVGRSGGVLGAALRPCAGISNPIYVSVGHRVGLETAVQLVWSCCRHRVPEPTRQADIKSREYIRVGSSGTPKPAAAKSLAAQGCPIST